MQDWDGRNRGFSRMRRINADGFGRRFSRRDQADRKMADRKIKNGSGILYFSVSHFSVSHFSVSHFSVRLAETMMKGTVHRRGRRGTQRKNSIDCPLRSCGALCGGIPCTNVSWSDLESNIPDAPL